VRIKVKSYGSKKMLLGILKNTEQAIAKIDQKLMAVSAGSLPN
jgi:hypothetical protein